MSSDTDVSVGVTSVMAKLDTHLRVLEEEVKEINSDICSIKDFVKKYGYGYWEKASKRLIHEKELRDQFIADIRTQLDIFRIHLEASKVLLSRLSKVQAIQLPVSASDLAKKNFVAVVSPILANRQSEKEKLASSTSSSSLLGSKKLTIKFDE